MARMYVWQTAILVDFVSFTVVLNVAEQCKVCQSPLRQNLNVPWAYELNDTIESFDGSHLYRLPNLPGNSFVSAPLIKVCQYTCLLSYRIWIFQFEIYDIFSATYLKVLDPGIIEGR